MINNISKDLSYIKGTHLGNPSVVTQNLNTVFNKMYHSIIYFIDSHNESY